MLLTGKNAFISWKFLCYFFFKDESSNNMVLQCKLCLVVSLAFINALKFSGLYDRSFLAMLESVKIKRVAFFST